MSPYLRRDAIIMPHRRSTEAVRPQGLSETSGQRARRRNPFIADETETDDEAFQGNDEATNLLLFTSVDTYRNSLLIQQEEPTVGANHGMRGIYQVITVQSPQCSTSYMESRSSLSMISESDEHERSPSPEPMEVSRESDDYDNESSITLESEERSENTDMLSSLDSTMSIISRDLSDSSDFEEEFTPVRNRRGCKHNKLLHNSRPTPKPTIARRRLRSNFKMPDATASAIQVANKLIKYARCIQNKYENEICCPTCGLFPIWPVTGSCGHTRCLTCTELMKTCPCGEAAPACLHINILIRDIQKNTLEIKSSSIEESTHTLFAPHEKMAVDDSDSSMSSASMSSSPVLLPKPTSRPMFKVTNSSDRRRLPMSSVARFNQGLELLMAGKYGAAAPHIALAAASYESQTRRARVLLAQCITIMSRNRDPRSLTCQLNHIVRDLCSTSWVIQSEMECILCCETFTNPVTTPCGHMFCRTCLERTMDYNKRCPLCLRSLERFNLVKTGDTKLVQAALKSIDLVSEAAPLEPDLIPIFVCTVAYPSVPCPLFIFDPRYWLMIRRVLESGSRKFGMVACDRGKSYVDYGTILEVRDCVHLEDGRSILSTIGLTRFKVVERGVRDGCEVARILPIIDIPVPGLSETQIKILSEKILLKAWGWIRSLNVQVKEDIEAAFGSLKSYNEAQDSYRDGPPWLWWVVAVLPLRSEIKVLILSTTCLLKRLLAVSRTLEAVDQVTLTTASPSECELRNNHARRAHAIQPIQLNEVNEQNES